MRLQAPRISTVAGHEPNLMNAGGWSNLAMPLGYAESAKIANNGAEVDG
jgi:hypothetical protein